MIGLKTATDVPQSLAAARSNRWQLLAVAAVLFSSILVFFSRLGDFPLFNPDEGLYAEPAREMLDTGEYITTLLNYVVRFTKPPLVMWFMALSYKVFGVNEFAARFSGALLAVFLVLMTYFFLARNLSRRTALYGAFVMLTAPMCIGVARTAITDMPLAFFTDGCLIALFTAFQTKRRWLETLGYVCIGLAVMTKGPIGVILPVLILGVYYLVSGKAREAIKFFNLPIGAAIVAAIALPWFVVEIYLTKGAYFKEFILRENFERFTSVVDSHKGGWWYHIVAVMVGLFPWSAFLPQALVAFFQKSVKAVRQSYEASQKSLATSTFYGKLKSLGKACTSLATQDSKEDLRLFAVCWALVTIVFYSASVSKLLTYTLPAFPALAALVAIELDEAIKALKPARLLAPLFAIAAICGGAAAFAKPIFSHLRDAPQNLDQLITAFASFESLATVGVLIMIAIGLRKEAVACFTLMLLLSILYFGQQLLPAIAQGFEGDIPTYARLAGESSDPIIVFDLRKPGIPFYARRKVVQPPDQESLERTIAKMNRAYVITRARNIEQFRDNGYELISKDNRFMLLRWQQ